MSISRAIGLISGINECVNLFQWAASSISSLRSRLSATQEKNIQDEVSHLQRSLQRLRDTLPAMYGLIDRAEWRSHTNCVAELLPILKDAVYDADDILDEFRWHELNVTGQGNTTHSAFADFYKTTIQGSFNKVNDIQERLNDISCRLNQIPGLHEVTPGFDKSVRPDTISSTSKEMFGRDRDLKQVMGLLGIPQNNRRAHPKRKRASTTANGSTSTPASNQVSNESRVQAIPVLPIVGMGGIGKTTLAQHICNHRQVKSYFDLIIWICADDFDVKRLTNDVIQSSTGKQANVDHLDSLQHALFENLSNKRFLIVVDDVWDDALKENGQRWEKFCAPFRNVVHGSMMLVTTRSPEVADGVRTMEPFLLDGLTDGVLWDFLKLCAFGSKTSNSSPDLERIGRSILSKLKGSPLAAITLGRLLRMNLDTSHWKNILESELWELKQKETDILPALRLSYMYLPFHLKRCFSFCSVYPKDHKFEKDRLAEIWAAEGFVEPQGDTPLIDIASQYFQDLFNRGTEVFEVLQPSTSLEHLFISSYPGVSLPSWFQPQNFPRLATHDSINGTLSSLRDLTISRCGNISLEYFLDPASVPAIRKIKFHGCTGLVSLPVSWFYLEELEVVNCLNICSQRLVAPYLKSLEVFNSGNLAHNMDCCSLTYFSFSGDCDTITLSACLEELCISDCRYLTSIRTGGIGVFPSLVSITVSGCVKLPTLDGFLTADLPAVEKITISECPELLSLPSERFGSFHSLKVFEVKRCRQVNWQRGLVLPSSLQELSFNDCGDISIVFPSCLQNLAFLVSLGIHDCQGIRSIPGNVWQSNLLSLKRLTIIHCPNLESIGGKEAIAKIEYVEVALCLKMEDILGIPPS
ncbi:putative disease resistance protein RGA1 [Lolium rigidum]|uniref:putative disease resistance protein RGA1 n=1 Tax=Lolium rigidum TaxID=89674 RepID=UPI001F5C1D41|nr:putative disease resistance protein RGA1 [Lolium rigidum]